MSRWQTLWCRLFHWACWRRMSSWEALPDGISLRAVYQCRRCGRAWEVYR